MACKGHLLALSEMRLDTPGGKAHFLEAVSRRHKRVNRSTFAAETNGLADALDTGKVLAMQFTEIVKGVCTAGQLASLSGSGAWALPLEAVVDAMSVLTTITAADIKLPLRGPWSRSSWRSGGSSALGIYAHCGGARLATCWRTL